MADHPILLSQKNEVFQFIKKAGIDPSSFAWEDRGSTYHQTGTVSALVHKPTGYYFKFDHAGDVRRSEYSPSREKHFALNSPNNWQQQCFDVGTWLACLKREINEPDLWGAILSQKALASAAPRAENAPFTPEERVRLASTLQEIKEYVVKTLATTQEQQALVISRLDYLVDASQRLGKKDWIMIAIGVFTGIAIEAAFAPDAAREMFRFAMQILGWVTVATPIVQ